MKAMAVLWAIIALAFLAQGAAAQEQRITASDRAGEAIAPDIFIPPQENAP